MQAGLRRTLSATMLNMITIGGSIGTGIFLASGHALYIAGPIETMLAFILTGITSFFLMSSLAEMAAYMPNTGSFYIYAKKFVNPSFGYALGWSYWYSWTVTIASEISAAALVMHFWYPSIPPIIWNVAFLICIIMINSVSVNAFGLTESLFSMIKLTLIIGLISLGIIIISRNIFTANAVAFYNWHTDQKLFQHGIAGLMGALMIAGFTFQGTELIGVAAGECREPEKQIPSVIGKLFFRILFVFILTMFIICTLLSHASLSISESSSMLSPFTLIFQQYGISGSATFVNIVILAAILSSGNCGLYISSRILFSMSENGDAPSFLGEVNNRGVPINALLVTIAMVTIIFMTSLSASGSIYLWLVNAASMIGFLAWFSIALSHYQFRRIYLQEKSSLAALPYRSRYYPYADFFVIGFCLIFLIAVDSLSIFNHKKNWADILIYQSGIVLFFLLFMLNRFKSESENALQYN